MFGGHVEDSRPITEPLPLAAVPVDDRLAVQARSNVEAFAPLYELHVERVFRYLRARGADENVAAELTSLTFERALRHIDRYRPGGPGFAPWLLRIARNAWIDAGRRQRERPLDLDYAGWLTDPGQSPEEAAIVSEERRWIQDLVARLPDAQRDALALRFAGGFSSREIAAVIGKSEAATNSASRSRTGSDPAVPIPSKSRALRRLQASRRAIGRSRSTCRSRPRPAGSRRWPRRNPMPRESKSRVSRGRTNRSKACLSESRSIRTHPRRAPSRAPTSRTVPKGGGHGPWPLSAAL